MIPTPAMIQPADAFLELSEFLGGQIDRINAIRDRLSYQPTAEDFRDMERSETCACPDVARLLTAAREVLASDARPESLAYLSSVLTAFAGVSVPDYDAPPATVPAGVAPF